MIDTVDWYAFWIFTTLLMALTAATVVGYMLRQRTELGVNPAVVEQFNQRVRAWWMLTARFQRMTVSALIDRAWASLTSYAPRPRAKAPRPAM